MEWTAVMRSFRPALRDVRLLCRLSSEAVGGEHAYVTAGITVILAASVDRNVGPSTATASGVIR
jgi:hypothetical protein